MAQIEKVLSKFEGVDHDKLVLYLIFFIKCKNITFSGNACHYEQIQFIFLMKNIPLSSFSMYTGNKYNQRVSRNFEETIRHLIKNYYRTLGNPMRTFQLPIFKLFWYF